MIFREISVDDYNQHIRLLSQLTNTGTISKSMYTSKIQECINNPYHHILCIEIKGIIIAIGSLYIENKIIHSCSSVGHIEDIVVDKEYRQKGYGKLLIEKLVSIAEEKGCYKVILTTQEKNIDFYHKSKFQIRGYTMAKYI